MTRADGEAPAIRISGVTKDFPVSLRGMRLRAVDDLSFVVPAGQIFGLLGPNGSGKSTTIKILLGLLRPTAGSCEIFGVPCSSPRARVQVGYLPEAPDFYRFLSGREFVRFHARLSGVPQARLEAETTRVVEVVGLAEAADRRVGTYSKGMLQRIGIAQALVHDPRLVILDEPTAGVDPVGVADITALILRLKSGGKTVLLSSHLLAQVESLCDRIAILHRGRLMLESSIEELRGSERATLHVEGLASEMVDDLEKWLASRGAHLTHRERPRIELDRLFVDLVRAKPPGEMAPDVDRS